jgi:hypothetical protein
MRGVVLLVMASACGRLGFDPLRVNADADPLTGDVAHDSAIDSATDAMAGSDAAMGSAFTRVQSTAATSGTGTQMVMLPSPTTAGTVLVATFALNSLGALTVPGGWTTNASSMINGACASVIATETSGAAGRQALSFTVNAGAPVSIQVSEWAGVNLSSPFDAVGMGGSSFSMLALSIATSGATTTAGDLAIASFCEDVQTPTFTPGAGWTNLGQVPVSSALPSLFTEFQQNLPVGQVTATGTGSLVAKYAATIVTLHSM